MKSKKQLGIGILIATFAFLAIAAFPPTWNGGQFQSVGGVFSHTNNGNLGTNQTMFETFTLTNSIAPQWNLKSGGAGLPGVLVFFDDVNTYQLLFSENAGMELQDNGGNVLFAVSPDGVARTRTGITNEGGYHGTGPLTNVADIKTDGNLIVTTAGKGIQIKTGSNATVGIATLVAGTKTVNTTAVTANSMIFFSRQSGNASAAYGVPEKGTVVAGTSFVIDSRDLMGTIVTDDVSTIAWWILEPAP